MNSTPSKAEKKEALPETVTEIAQKYPTKNEIAERARKIYVENGCREGYDLDHWLQAEYELLQLPTDKLATLDLDHLKNFSNCESLIALIRTYWR